MFKHRHTDNNNSYTSCPCRHCYLILMSPPNVTSFVCASPSAGNQRHGKLTGGAVLELGSGTLICARGNANEPLLRACTLAGIIKFGGGGVFQFKYLIRRDTALLCMPLDGNLNNIYMSFMSFKAAPKSGVSTVCTLKAVLIPLASRIPRRRICK